jgi:type I restriction enzyme S subunit
MNDIQGAEHAIPEHWKRLTIGEIGNVVTGSTPSTKDESYWNGDVPFISPADFNKTVYVGKTGRTLSLKGARISRLLPRNAILVTCIGSLGGIAISSKPSTTNQQINAVIVKDEESSLFHFYNILFNIHELEKNAGTTTLPIINKSTFELIRLLRPPFIEQQKIAKILTSVDEVIEKTQAQIDKLKDLKTGTMQELLTNGIGHTEFKDSTVGRIPDEWEVKPLVDVVQKIIDCEHKTAPYVDKSEYLVVRTSNVRNGELIHQNMKFTTEDGFKEWTKRTIPSVGDVLFTREAPAGESCLVPNNFKLCMGQRMVLLRLNNERINPDYFSIYLNSEMSSKEIYQLSIGTTVSRINIDDIKKIKCVVPPLSEQNKIADSVSSIQANILNKQEKLNSLIKIKKALMQDLLTGKVRVDCN